MKAGFVGFVGLMAVTTVALGLIPGDGVMVASAVDVSVANTLDCVDTVLDFVPVVGALKDIVALTIGVNPVTGDPVSTADTAILIAWMFLPTFVRGAGKALLRSTQGLLS